MFVPLDIITFGSHTGFSDVGNNDKYALNIITFSDFTEQIRLLILENKKISKNTSLEKKHLVISNSEIYNITPCSTKLRLFEATYFLPTLFFRTKYYAKYICNTNNLSNNLFTKCQSEKKRKCREKAVNVTTKKTKT